MVKVPFCMCSRPSQTPATKTWLGRVSSACLGPPLRPEGRPFRVWCPQFIEFPTRATALAVYLAKVRFPLRLQKKRYDVNVELNGYSHVLRYNTR